MQTVGWIVLEQPDKNLYAHGQRLVISDVGLETLEEWLGRHGKRLGIEGTD